MTIQDHQKSASKGFHLNGEQTRYPCPICNAAAGVPCLLPSRRPRLETHAERLAHPTARGTSTLSSIEENKRTALAFANAYLLTQNRAPVAARLTPQEREVGARALNSMQSGRHFLQMCHEAGGSLENMAAKMNRPLYVVAEGYSDAVRDLASYASPLLEACCKFCRRQMPDVIFDASLRCPICLASIQDLCKPIPNALDIQELKASCAVLAVAWTTSIFEIEARFEERLKLWNWLVKSAAERGKRDPQAKNARAKDFEAWKFIKTLHTKYGN